MSIIATVPTSCYFLYFILGYLSSEVNRKRSAVNQRKVSMTSLPKTLDEIEVGNLL